jgi:hypothetical protein
MYFGNFNYGYTYVAQCSSNTIIILGNTLEGTHRHRMFENRVLGKISGPKREEVTRDGTKLHNENLYDLCTSPGQEFKQDMMGGECGTNGREQKYVLNFCEEKLRKETTWNI